MTSNSRVAGTTRDSGRHAVDPAVILNDPAINIEDVARIVHRLTDGDLVRLLVNTSRATTDDCDPILVIVRNEVLAGIRA